MVEFKNKLDELLADAVLSTGPSRQAARIALDTYKNTLTDAQFAAQIQEITSIPELNYLQSVGVPKGIYNIFLAQISKQIGQGVPS